MRTFAEILLVILLFAWIESPYPIPRIIGWIGMFGFLGWIIVNGG